METLYYILLGIVQGLTEFLPVSSSGHLVLLNKIFNIDSGNFLFVSILLHVATLISVCIYFHKQILNIIKHPFSSYSLFIIFATIPTILIVLIFKSFFTDAFLGNYLSICFMITAIILMLSYFKTTKSKYNIYKKLDFKNSIIIGLCQGFAVLPGISRSGTTISAGIMLGLNKDECTNFSFILSIPIIIGSLIYEIYTSLNSGMVLFIGSYFNLFLGFIFAIFFGLLAIKIMKKIATNNKYYLFSIYLIFISILSCFL